MQEFTFTVAETTVVQKLYVVRADSREEAEEMAGRGDTESETALNLGEVIDRTILE